MLDRSARDLRANFPIVGVGASTGGLDAFVELLRCVPAGTNIAFVMIQHLDRAHESRLSEALREATQMPVVEATHGALVEARCVYVITANTELTLSEGRLVLAARPADGAVFLPVDAFMRSLGDDVGSRAIGVILSGSASDGTEGLRAIQAQGGVTLVQRPESARFPGMPQAAVDANVADYCLTIPELGGQLVRLSRHAEARKREGTAQERDAEARREILSRVQSAFGIDFSEFKPGTVFRRLARRMAIRSAADLKAYLRVLEMDPEEVRALYEELLIHVTGFFRDPEVFQALRSAVLPEIFKQRAPNAPIRAWVAGCATGEEAYSVAILLIEHGIEHGLSLPIQVFGSDVSEVAISKARAGVYAESALGGLSEEYRRRYLTKVDGGFRIDKGVRDRCVFVRHDVSRDPPFSKMDLVCCRNVLIYFKPSLQKKVVPLLHYSLSQPGFLVLGRSESISMFGELFSVMDKGHKIFKRSEAVSSLRFQPRTGRAGPLEVAMEQRSPAVANTTGALSRYVDQLLLARYAPPGVLIDKDMNVLLYHGQTGAFLQAAPGQPQRNVINMARNGLVGPLSTAVRQACADKVVVRDSDVVVEQNGTSSRCDLVVIPFTGLPGNDELLFIVLFERRAQAGRAVADAEARAADAPSEIRRTAQLEHELTATKTYLHALVQEHGRANDDLERLNEELVAGNEELQSMNEELETAKEELQSTVEELTTLNDELRGRNQQIEKLATEADRARAQAERANRAKDDFLATLSHELRTPLSTMLLESQQLRAGAPPDSTGLARASAALERATRAQARLIDDLLDVSRIVAGKLALSKEGVDFGGLVHGVLESARTLLEAKSLSLTASIEPEIVPVWVDAGRMQQAISNLLANAVKFTPAGGRVTVSAHQRDDAVHLHVSDTGIGIAAEFLPHVFARFSQSDTSITRKYGGLGLGLALVRHIVELHGGTVAAESAGQGLGASFSITLPLASVEAGTTASTDVEPARPATSGPYERLAGLRVLFVDDDFDTREAVREVLYHTGARVELAASAAEGMAALDGFEPDVLLCDIAMPGEDGYSFMRRVRARAPAQRSAIPALALTALASDEDRVRALAAGFDMHMAKPVDIDRLKSALLELSGRASR